MLIFITVLTFLLATSLVFYLQYTLLRRKNPLADRLSDLEKTNPFRAFDQPFVGEVRDSGVEKVFEPLSKLLPKSPDEVGATAKKLMRAGYKSKSAVTIFYGIKVVLILAAVLALVFFLRLQTMPIENAIIAVVACLGGGYILPDFILSTRVTARQERIQLALPDALDLLVVCVEAGLGLDQAILKTSEELRVTHPDLCEELNLVNLELRAGKPRKEALKNLADRTGVEDIGSLVTMLIQTDKFGTSIAQSLRVHSDVLRTKRRQRAEEKAHKVSVKLVFPLVFLIFPAMFVIILGPGVIKIVQELFPALQR
ncbi:MAG: type II secretion system F family protein [Acidobacteriota bacterium]